MLYAWGSIFQAGFALLSPTTPCSREHIQHRKDKLGGVSSYAMRLAKLKAMIKNATSSYEYCVATTKLAHCLQKNQKPFINARAAGNLSALPEHLRGYECLTTHQHSGCQRPGDTNR